MRTLLTVLVVALALLYPSGALACTDSGMPPDGPTSPFDAGPGCILVIDGCGIYRAVCDAGAPEGSPPGCAVGAPTATPLWLLAASALLWIVRSRSRRTDRA